MIYITGDTHGINGLKERIASLSLSKRDYLIVAGDFGVIWDPKKVKEDIGALCNVPCHILFVDGNHENFDLLNAYPISKWNGGKVHRICDNTYHLMRGQVFEIEGKKFFTFGGATSRDRDRRVEHISWWKEEEPSEADYQEGIKNLAFCDNKVDYVVTHSPLACTVKRLFARSFDDYPYGSTKYRRENNRVSYRLSSFAESILLKAEIFFSGHQHVDEFMEMYGQKYCLLYKNVIPIENN